MNQTDLEYIVGLVTQQVMAAMNQGSSAQDPQYEGMSKILVVGPENAPIPEDLRVKANRFANLLMTRGVKKGDKVAILLMNCLEWLPVYFGILKAGCIAVPMNFRYSSDEIKNRKAFKGFWAVGYLCVE